mgnify:FL=1
MKLEKKMMNKQNRWLDLAQELQFLAQGGLAYTKDKFDQEDLSEFVKYLQKWSLYKVIYRLQQLLHYFVMKQGFKHQN